MDYVESENALAAAAASGKPDALQALARFYAFCGRNLWCFEMNREPTLACPVLPFKDWDEFDAFFRAVPKGLDFGALFARAKEAYRKTLAAAAAARERELEASSWMELASVDDLSADDDDAERAHERAAALFGELKDEEGLGEVCMARAHRARYRVYDMAACRRFLEEARAHYDRAGSTVGAAHAVVRLAETYDPGIDNGELANADRMEALFAEAAGLFERAGDKDSAANALAGVANIFKEAGEKERQEAAYLRCLAYIEKNFGGEDLALNYDAAAALYDERENPEKAADYRRKAAALRPAS
jgi:tetratricopeptide (TPR) repeat protein